MNAEVGRGGRARRTIRRSEVSTAENAENAEEIVSVNIESSFSRGQVSKFQTNLND